MIALSTLPIDLFFSRSYRVSIKKRDRLQKIDLNLHSMSYKRKQNKAAKVEGNRNGIDDGFLEVKAKNIYICKR